MYLAAASVLGYDVSVVRYKLISSNRSGAADENSVGGRSHVAPTARAGRSGDDAFVAGDGR